MTRQSVEPSRKFPRLAWAWPDGPRHQLIAAAICPDNDRAFAAITAWLASVDLDDATFAEHRLLSAITTRFADQLKSVPEYGRLRGLQRLHWTKSRMAIAAVTPALKTMTDQGLKLILLKGSCRVALDPSEQKARTSYDLDLLLNSEDLVSAFEVLAAQGWQSTRGESTMGLRARISSVRARNFKKGRFGDIDLHQFAYHHANADPVCDQKIFDDSQPVHYYGFNVFIPNAQERLAMAIGHGGWDGHSHSDWLVDAASIISREAVDWPKFVNIIFARNLGGAAAVALSYLQQYIGLTIPEDAMQKICGKGDFASPRQIPAMFLAKDADYLSKPQRVVRKAIENVQKARFSGRDRASDTVVLRSFAKKSHTWSAATVGLQQQLDMAEIDGPANYNMHLVVELNAPALRRRFEFEINGPNRNLCHLQAIHWHKRAGKVRVEFKGEIALTPQDYPIVLCALPGKLIEKPGTEAERQKYEATPFSLIHAKFELLECK